MDLEMETQGDKETIADEPQENGKATQVKNPKVGAWGTGQLEPNVNEEREQNNTTVQEEDTTREEETPIVVTNRENEQPENGEQANTTIMEEMGAISAQATQSNGLEKDQEEGDQPAASKDDHPRGSFWDNDDDEEKTKGPEETGNILLAFKEPYTSAMSTRSSTQNQDITSKNNSSGKKKGRKPKRRS